MNAPLVVTLLLCAGLVAPSAAALSCDPQETVKTCSKRIKGLVKAAAKDKQATMESVNDAAAVAAADRLLRRETGVDAGGLASSVKNLLPLLSLSGLVGAGDAAADADSPVALDFNELLPQGLGGDRVQLRGIANTAPDLAAPVKDELNAIGRGDAVERLQDRLNALDDTGYSLTYSLSGRSWGRDFANYRARLSALQLRAWKVPALHADGQMITLCKTLDCGGGVMFKDLRCLASAPACDLAVLRAQYMAAVAASAEGTAASELDLEETFRTDGIDAFDQLVNNQPQLHLSATHLARTPLVGADVNLAKLAFEMGLVNVNSFEKAAREAQVPCAGEHGAARDWQGADKQASEECYTAYRNYVEDHRAALAAADRLAVAVEFARLGEMHVAEVEESLDLTIPASSRYAGELAYGRYLDADSQTRIDGAARYELYRNDALRADRWSLSLVITQRVAGVSVPFTVFYRSGGEFESDEASQLGTMIGVNFDVLEKPARKVQSLADSLRRPL